MSENLPIVTLPKGFERSEYTISGVRTVVYEAGSGQPLVFLHGSGTFTGFDFLDALTAGHRVIVPYHPGFGESDDDRDIDDIHDYVLHYLELFQTMGLADIDLVGFSFGGWIAAELATFHPQLFRRIVLVAPSGLPIFDPPATDVMTIPAAQLPAYLAHDPSVLSAKLPSQHDVDFLTLNYRERIALARVVWDTPSGNRKLARRLHRISVPVLLLWGQEDRIRPAAHGETWSGLLPDARLEVLPDAGHLLFDETPKAVDHIAAFLG
jgi:pimeloyl-ACP methyl ester carboxylesterase